MATAASSPLHRRTWGDGAQTALLLHGAASSSDTWWRVGPALAEHGFTVTAVDLPSHGASAPLESAATPAALAARIAPDLAGDWDVVIGHSLGAAVALELATGGSLTAGHLVLEELPGADSCDWGAEAALCRDNSRAAVEDPAGLLAELQHGQRQWDPEDYRAAIVDLARCDADSVAAGLESGPDWPGLAEGRLPTAPVLLLLAPDKPGHGHGEDATALRGTDRRQALDLATSTVVLPAGHCIHRDLPEEWVFAVTQFVAG